MFVPKGSVVINLIVSAPDKVFDLFHGVNRIRRLPIKGLYGKVLPFEEYVTLMRRETLHIGDLIVRDTAHVASTWVGIKP